MFSVLASAPPALVLFGVTTTTKAKSSPLASDGVLILILLVAGAYLLFIRPSRMKMRAAQSASPINVGDEVVTNSGIIGRVVRFEGERVIVQIAPGTNVMVHRTALGRRVEPRDLEYYQPASRRAPPSTTFRQKTAPRRRHRLPGDGERPQESGDTSPSTGSPT